MKKGLWILIALLAAILVFNPLETEAASVNDLTFQLNRTGDGYIVSDCSSSARGELVIPETYRGLPVTEIGSYAFFDYNELTGIAIPDSVTTIGRYAFGGCAKLTSITIGSGVSSIGEYAFPANTILDHVYIHDVKAWCEIEYGNTQSVPLYFADNFYLNGEPVTDLVIPEGTTRITQNAFIGYDLLTTITIPDSVTSIGESAFHFCKGLTSVTIPDSVTFIGEWAFADCDSLQSVVLGKGVANIAECTFANCTLIMEFTVTDNLVSVHDAAFSGSSIQKLIIADGSKAITKTMVICPNKLRYVEIPATVSSIGMGAFAKTNILVGVYIHDISAWCQIEYYYEQTADVYNPVRQAGNLYLNGTLVKELVIPDDVPYIADYAFYGNTSLTSVTIPDSVKSIGESAFMCCTALTDVKISDGVRSIGKNAFGFCDNLTDVSMGNGVTSIGESAFEGCNFLTDIVIPNGVTSLPEYVFRKCYRLENVTIGNGVTSIGDYAFWDCSSLKSITIPGSVTYIGGNAFRDCTGLTSITIPDSVTSIGGYAFYGCKALTSVTIPDSVISIGSETFTNCTGLSYNIYENGKYLGNDSNPYVALIDTTTTQITSAQIHPKTKVIGGEVFGNCRWLTKVVIPNGVVGIGNGAFYGCYNLASITIPDSITHINGAAFKNCSGLTSITIPDTITVINAQTFYGCASLTSVTIPDSVTYIGEAAFKECTSLTSIMIPDSVTDMEQDVFHGCTALTDIKMSSGIKIIRRYMFQYCRGLISFIIPEGVTDIEIAAFDGCDKLATVIYCGTPQKWSSVNIKDLNEPILQATVQYHNYENGVCTICRQYDEGFWVYRLDANKDLAQESTVYINGLPCEVKTDGEGRYLELPKAEALLLVTYTYHTGDGQDIHTQYPTGMKVYLVKDGKITHIPELDNLLQYSGASIRITGKKGIRMITSIEKEKKTALTGKGLAGYKLLEYGTALCFASEIPEGDALVLGRDFTRSNYAYKKGKADPVFATTKDLVQYTNVLVGFSLNQCKDDIAMRPYIILEDAQGNQVTLYGGTIYRSIGYIAYQNRTVFKPKTASYNYVWEIIHHVYGDKYDADYKG